MSGLVAFGGLAHRLGARRRGVAFMRIAARRTKWAGRRDFTGAWIRPNSGVSDRSCIPPKRRQEHGDIRRRQPQMRLGGAASTCVARRLSMGSTKTEAIRALRRQISDEVYGRLRRDQSERFAALNAVAA